MADWSRFKPEVFGSLPIGVICLLLVLISVSFPNWLTHGKGAMEGEDANATDSRLENVEFGLFYGGKTRTRGGSCSRGIMWVCSGGVCMLSCGANHAQRKADIDDILAVNITSTGDDKFCPQCSSDGSSEDVIVEATSIPNPELLTTKSGLDDPSSLMVREGMLRSVQVFLVIGIVFTFVNVIFTAANITHNPVSSIAGIDGLVIWNVIAATSYLLVLILWGAEYNLKLRANLCISDTLRQGPITWTSSSRIGWCCLLLICPMILHYGVGVMLGYRQYRRYYSSQQKQQKEQRLAVQDPTQGGTDILF